MTAFFQSTLPALGGAVFHGMGAFTFRSLADGARGSWVQMGVTGGDEVAYAEVPPSPMLPDGRLLAGVWNGITYSDDGAASFHPSSAYGAAAYIATSFAFVPQEGHPYGGVVYAGVEDLAFYPGSDGAVLRSDDGGGTWAAVHRFTDGSLYGMAEVNWVYVFATPDGVLWGGLLDPNGMPGPEPAPGAIVRSTDGGVTWARADAGYGGWSVNSLSLSRTGVLYAATEKGVWRTTAPVVAVAGEASPGAAPEIGVSVRPNPAGGRVEVVLRVAEAGAARVVVVDALGREVAVVVDGPVAQGERAVAVETGSWPAGVYVVRARVGRAEASARLVVAR